MPLTHEPFHRVYPGDFPSPYSFLGLSKQNKRSSTPCSRPFKSAEKIGTKVYVVEEDDKTPPKTLAARRESYYRGKTLSFASLIHVSFRFKRPIAARKICGQHATLLFLKIFDKHVNVVLLPGSNIP